MRLPHSCDPLGLTSDESDRRSLSDRIETSTPFAGLTPPPY
jgi:hypothetical protein